MIEKLQAELLKAHDSLSVINIKIGGEEFTFYYRYLGLLEKSRIQQMCVKPVKTLNKDGSVDITYEAQEELTPIFTILEKALDEDGKRVFDIANPEHFKIVSELPVGASSRMAYEMSVDIFGTLGKDNG